MIPAPQTDDVRTVAEGIALSVAGLKLPALGLFGAALLVPAGAWFAVRVYRRTKSGTRAQKLHAAAVTGLWFAGAVAIAFAA